MGWFGNAIGSVFKVILSPLIEWVMSLFYGILIRGPLSFLNTLQYAFDQVSGTEVDKLLFSTSMANGKPQLNFFSSSSPLKTYFLIMLGIAGALLAVFIGIMIAKATIGKKNGPLRKVGQVTVSMLSVMMIPLVFLTSLSLIGGLMSAISGKQIAMTNEDIGIYSQKLAPNIQRLKDSPNSAATLKPELKFKVKGLPGLGNPTRVEATIEEIYTDLKDDLLDDNNINSIGEQVANDYHDVITSIFLLKNGVYELNPTLLSQLNNLQITINNLTPNMKNEKLADKAKTVQDTLQQMQTSIEKWVEDSQTLISYWNNKETTDKEIALSNYRNAFLQLWPETEPENTQVVGNIRDLNQIISYTISGSFDNPSSGIISLRQRLSNFQDSELSVIFYQVATGNTDSNWDRSGAPLKNDGFMILIGFGLILAACVIMGMAALFAVMRIFDLALLFIISPAVVLLAPLDDGKRFGTWMNMTIAKGISILGIVITLRLFSTLNHAFIELLNANPEYDGNNGYLVKLILMGLFGIGGMLAAYKSSQTLSVIVGAGQGIMDGLQGRQVLGILKSASLIGGGAMKGVARGLGLKGGGNSGGSSLSSGGVQRSRLGKITDTWKSRSSKVNSAAAKITRGKVGSSDSKVKYHENTFNKKKSKFDKSQRIKENKKSLKDMNRYKSKLKETKKNNGRR